MADKGRRGRIPSSQSRGCGPPGTSARNIKHPFHPCMRALLHVWRSLALCDSRLMTSGARCAQGHTRLAAPSAPPWGECCAHGTLPAGAVACPSPPLPVDTLPVQARTCSRRRRCVLLAASSSRSRISVRRSEAPSCAMPRAAQRRRPRGTAKDASLAKSRIWRRRIPPKHVPHAAWS